MSEMVERVARAIQAQWFARMGIKIVPLPDEAADSWKGWIPEARAAIAAMREPTPAMVGAVDAAQAQLMNSGTDHWGTDEFWHCMIDAALE